MEEPSSVLKLGAHSPVRTSSNDYCSYSEQWQTHEKTKRRAGSDLPEVCIELLSQAWLPADPWLAETSTQTLATPKQKMLPNFCVSAILRTRIEYCACAAGTADVFDASER